MTSTKNKSQLLVIATTSEKVKDLTINDGQLIFIQDKSRIAFDFKGKRVFYNQITELDTEYERTLLFAPSYGYYFVIETAVLWSYQGEWIQVTHTPDDIVFIGVELPELGQSKKLYVDTKLKEISVWDDSISSYVVVADKTEISDVPGISIETVTQDDIDTLF